MRSENHVMISNQYSTEINLIPKATLITDSQCMETGNHDLHGGQDV